MHFLLSKEKKCSSQWHLAAHCRSNQETESAQWLSILVRKKHTKKPKTPPLKNCKSPEMCEPILSRLRNVRSLRKQDFTPVQAFSESCKVKTPSGCCVWVRGVRRLFLSWAWAPPLRSHKRSPPEPEFWDGLLFNFIFYHHLFPPYILFHFLAWQEDLLHYDHRKQKCAEQRGHFLGCLNAVANRMWVIVKIIMSKPRSCRGPERQEPAPQADERLL